MKHITIIIILFCCMSCSKNSTVIEGDLYFKLIQFDTYLMTDAEIGKLKNGLKKDNTSNRKIVDYLNLLQKHNLLNKPSILLKIDNGKIIRLFLTQNSFSILNKYELSELKEVGHKVKLRFETEPIAAEIYLEKNILAVNEVEGQTEFRK